MLQLHADVRVGTQAAVLPQVVARAALLELTQEELEETVRERLEANPALESAYPGGLSCPSGADDGDWLARLPATVTLRDDLLWQVGAVSHGLQRHLAEYLIDCLDERGYLAADIHEVAWELSVPEEEVARALHLVQQLEPRGVGARDLAECLRLQVQAMRPQEVPPGLVEFLEGAFQCIVHEGSARALAETSAPGAALYLRFIRERLYPYPADLFQAPLCQDSSLPACPPDAVVTRERGRLRVSIPISQRLALRINAAYEALAQSMERRSTCAQGQQVRRMVAEAREFMQNLSDRHGTVARVAAALVREQEEFVLHGPASLKPLTKKELARKLGMHESTVCRATRGKTIMLPDGQVVSFDVFFEDALPVKAALAQVIRREDPGQPLRDGELADHLRQRGYAVARRTVTKYRTGMGIPPASQRRAYG